MEVSWTDRVKHGV